jgi:hypothetical protein
MLADPPFLLNLLAAEKQLSAKACPCPVDKIELSSDIRSHVLHTLILDNPEDVQYYCIRSNMLAYYTGVRAFIAVL